MWAGMRYAVEMITSAQHRMMMEIVSNCFKVLSNNVDGDILAGMKEGYVTV
jgi:hypothetical protein